MIILGIDPGTVRVGYGIIETEKNTLRYIASGILPLPPTTGSLRLTSIEKELRNIITLYCPQKVGVEKLFFSKNKKTALAVAEARGVIINTILSYALPLSEFTPNEVKVAATGSGNASKQAVAKMVSLLLHIPTSKLLDDTTDALAIAITAANKTVAFS
ncbi:MAG: crossover junction endodeoxyribonuclease RuvC [Candidatus Paceibacterota bacterium]|jgi:crossover junction endodeoxyribonuclease RuvC